MLWNGGALALLSGMAFVGLRAFAAVASLRGPSRPFDPMRTPPPPDYAQSESWLAFPGRNDLERSAPLGMTVVDEVYFLEPRPISMASPQDWSREARITM